MANIAYMRVSTKDQSIARQKAVFKERGIHLDKVFDEPKSGKDTDRPRLKEMLAYIREGDTVYIESISRLARNTRDFLDLVDIITNQKITTPVLRVLRYMPVKKRKTALWWPEQNLALPIKPMTPQMACW